MAVVNQGDPPRPGGNQREPDFLKEMRENMLAAHSMAPKTRTSTDVNEQYDFTTGQDIAHKTAQEISQLQGEQWGNAYDGRVKDYVVGDERLRDLAKHMSDAGYDPYSIPVIQQGRLASRTTSNNSSTG